MRVRSVSPYKILFVAMGGVAACATGVKPDSTPTQPPIAQEKAAVATSVAPPAASPAPPKRSTEAGDKDPKLIALAAELDAAGASKARAQSDHFRPLCDADGYPLVGNLARKGPPPKAEDYTPTMFCAELRANAKK